ncbi:hypothetical protein DFJ77DRAFT_425396 [Powellomyces hirtus]|nr:hypothetical protein DFJ77DRAFT_425396 [Powellomyces hirtus]
MVYAVGKLNEGQHNLYERVQEHVAALATPAPGSPLANGGTPAKLFLEDLIRIQQVLAQKAPHSANVVAPGMQVDPFFLRNQVARFDASPHCDELQKKAEKLVRRHALFQSGLYASSLLAVHLGVPFAVMAPIAVAISAAALGWMRLRWGSLETRFWGNVSHAYKTLKENILGVYEKGFTRGVAEPLVSVIRLLEEAIETRRAEVARNRKAVETVLESANRP